MNLKAQMAAAKAELEKAMLEAEAAGLEIVDAWDDFIGNPGVKLAWDSDFSLPQAKAFEAAKVEYARVAQASHSETYGPMLRDYYARIEG